MHGVGGPSTGGGGGKGDDLMQVIGNFLFLHSINYCARTENGRFMTA